MIKRLKVFSILSREGCFNENNHANFSGEKKCKMKVHVVDFLRITKEIFGPVI